MRVCSGAEVPNLTETQAIAAVLHSFYTGLENIFKRVAQENGIRLSSENWHSNLLQAMKEPPPNGMSVLDAEA
jgi:hypothetical protein